MHLENHIYICILILMRTSFRGDAHNYMLPVKTQAFVVITK